MFVGTVSNLKQAAFDFIIDKVVIVMSENVKHKFGHGISPQQFIDGMTVNKEKFENVTSQFSWDEHDRTFLQDVPGKDSLHFLIIAADWCGDVIRNVPIIFQVLEESGIKTEVYIIEEHLDLIDQFRTFGGRSIPVVILVDDQGKVIGRWGPRPSFVQEPMATFKAKDPDRNAPDYAEKMDGVYAEIHKRYGEGTEYHSWIVEELQDLLNKHA